MLDSRPDLTCCARCADVGAADRAARRHRYKSTVFPPPQERQAGAAGSRGGGAPPGVASGVVLDASPHVLVISDADGPRTFTVAPGARVWRGGAVAANVVRAGDQVVIRLAKGRRNVADRVWAGIGRSTGVIVDRRADTLLVDEGATRDHQVVVLSSRATSRIQVRFPELAPGHLVDVIGLRRGDVLEALIPATALPPSFGPDPVPRGHAPTRRGGTFRGCATWHEPAAPGEPAEGVAYPAVDPASGCVEAAASARPAGCGLPFLAVGSRVQVGNECTGDVRLLPVTTCGAVARLFSDRCLACGASPRNRIADLTVASFVGLGGELERGCFNASVTIGW